MVQELYQANSDYELFFQSIKSILQNMLYKYLPNHIDQMDEIMFTCFATAPYASKVPIHCK